MNEEILSDARANYGMVRVEGLAIFPQKQSDGYEHEKSNGEGDEMDDREDFAAVTLAKETVVNAEWDDDLSLRLPERQILVLDGSGSEGSSNEESDNEGGGNEGGGNEGNVE
ncbi:hypothetical protein Bca52824_032747 [Brassica carinata]|uniref:Uncharacterized protein n=1 Tax=Brassica carinata TaxID=52824 RepID=A0A8X7V7U6_BRACI|nr:hypothetical protein Bca52824_032747 [Brassica carinata]